MRTKYLFKLKYCGYNLKKVIFFPKEYFPSEFFCLDHTLEDNDDIFLISKIDRGPQVACSRMTLLNGKERV